VRGALSGTPHAVLPPSRSAPTGARGPVGFPIVDALLRAHERSSHRARWSSSTANPAADVALDAAALDRIDEIVRRGVTLNPADTSFGEHVLTPGRRRR
jgi:hypothetical protein